MDLDTGTGATGRISTMKLSTMNLWLDDETELPASRRRAGITARHLEDGQGQLAGSSRRGQVVVLVLYGVGNLDLVGLGVDGCQEVSAVGNRLRNVDVDDLSGGGVQRRDLVAGALDHRAVAVVAGGLRLHEASTGLHGHQRRRLVAAGEYPDERAEDREHSQALPPDAGE